MPHAKEPLSGLIVFDDGSADLAPVTDLRATFDVRSGGLTMLERFDLALAPHRTILAVMPQRTGLVRAHADDRHVVGIGQEIAPPTGAWLVVNGQCHLPLSQIESLAVGQALVEAGDGALVAAACTGAAAMLLCDPATRPDALRTLAATSTEELVLLRRPWELLAQRDLCIGVDLDLMLASCFDADEQGPGLPEGVTVIGDQRVWIDEAAAVYPTAVIDAEQGPVYVAPQATVRPGATVCGPCWIGPGATVLDHAVVRPNTAIGPVCKVAGEISGCVLQGFSNKGHEGFLGDSWIGQWVNLGAGTTNSNLLNTYSEVPVQQHAGGSRHRTGRTFLGAIIGDHVKTAICTRLMTGCVVHTGVMWARSEPIAGAVGGFMWATDAGLRAFRFDKFEETVRAMMARRKREPSPAEIEHLRSLHTAAVAAP